MILEVKEELYNGCNLRAICDVDDTGKKWYSWQAYQQGKLLFQDHNQIDGTPGFQSTSHALNDAKKNIDSLIRTGSL